MATETKQDYKPFGTVDSLPEPPPLQKPEDKPFKTEISVKEASVAQNLGGAVVIGLGLAVGFEVGRLIVGGFSDGVAWLFGKVGRRKDRNPDRGDAHGGGGGRIIPS